MTAKKYIRLLFVVLLINLFTSCNKFLEVETVGRTTMPNFFSNVDGLKAGLTGTYSQMFNYYSSEFYKYPEVAGNMVDLRIISENADMVDQFNFTSDPEQEVAAVGGIWKKIYETLANANNLLEYQPVLLVSFPQEKAKLDNIRAQALFIRALCHFDLCRVYSQPYNYTADASHLGIPVLTRTPGPDDNPARNTVKEVYDQILKDLLEAEELFGDSSMKDAYHASKKSTQALLSRVYLYTENWDKAIEYATKVIDNSELAYGDDYLAMYHNLTEGKEAILRLNGTLKSVSLGKFYSPLDPIAMPADTLISLYDDSDIRFQLFEQDKNNPSKYATSKFAIKVDYSIGNERYDPIILRVSEMYLNRAEAYLNKNDLTNAASDLKVIIARAMNLSVTDVIVNYSNKEDLFDLIKKERAKEFCFEGHNFFDIVRQKDNLVRGQSTNSIVKYLPYPNDEFVLPISQYELDANLNIVGNPTVN